MGISFGSIGTGLPKDIVQQIIKAEKIPIKKMEGRKEKIKDKQKLVNDLIGLMNSIKTNLNGNASARSLRELSVDYNQDLVDIAIDKNAANPGSYQLEVVQMARKSSAMTSGFEDRKESYVGVGYIEYTLPTGESKEIYVDSENASLDGIAKLINNDSSNGMQANVINDGSDGDTPWRLVLSLTETGDLANADFPYFYFVDGEQDLFLEVEREAQDAIIKLDGFEIEVPSNKVSDLIPGVVIDLKKAKPGEEFTVKVGEDSEAVTGKINDIVDTINGVFQFIKGQNDLDENTDTSRTLGGDLILQSLEGRLRSAIFKDVKTTKGFKRLSDIGITFQRDGLLKLDQKRFDAKVKGNYELVSQVLVGRFTKDEGNIKGVVDNVLDVVSKALQNPTGLLSSRKKSLESNISQIDRRIESKERVINQKEKNLKAKFARLEETMSRIKHQGAGLAALGAQPAEQQQLG